MRFNKAQLAAVLAAASKDETRYNLNGVLFESERLVATDGHRLHMVDGDKTTQETPVIIAYESCKRILQAMGAKDTAEIVAVAGLNVPETLVHISPSGIEIACEVIAGEFLRLEGLQHRQNLGGKGFVQIDEVHVFELESRSFQSNGRTVGRSN